MLFRWIVWSAMVAGLLILCDLFEESVWNWSDDTEVLYDADRVCGCYGAVVEVYFADCGGDSETGVAQTGKTAG